VGLALFGSGCTVRASAPLPPIDSAPIPRVTAKETEPNNPVVQIGTASWYGRNFHGRKTASGERFDQQAFTAAHRILPIGARVRVTKLDTNKWVDVEINDRGPFITGRIIDLSFAAARALDMLQEGTTKVRVEVLSTPDEASGAN
jgi:rare lipoprotein A